MTLFYSIVMKSQVTCSPSSDSAKWGWLFGGKEGKLRKDGDERGFRGDKRISRGIGAISLVKKTVRREDFSVAPGKERKVINEDKTELNEKEGRLPSLIEPGSMVGTQPDTEM